MNNIEKNSENFLWQKFIDQATNRPYYVNKETNETTWEQPADNVEDKSFNQEMDHSKFKNQNGNQQSTSENNSNPKQINQDMNPPEGMELAEENKLPLKMDPENGQMNSDQKHSDYTDINTPANWRTAIDHETGRHYHYNIHTRETRWNNPNEMVSQIPTTGDFTYHPQVTGRRRRRSMKEMQDAWDRGDRVGLWECPDCSKILTEGSKKTHPDSCNARKARSVHMVQGTPSDILAGAHWRPVQDRNGQTYYYHQITKQTTWYKPHEMHNFEQYQQTQAVLQNSLGPSTGTFSPWTEVTDSSGRVYYYNNITGATNWNRPDDFNAESHNGNGNEAENAMQYSSTMAETSVSNSNAAANIGEWIEVIDSSSGNKYYYNSLTKATSWNNPAIQQEQIKQEEIKPQEEENKGEKNLNENGISNWKEAIDKSNGRKYYYNTLTNDTSWEKPQELLDREAKLNASENAKRSDESHWMKIIDEKTGIPYFHNPVTQETTWDKPDSFFEGEIDRTDSSKENNQKLNNEPQATVKKFKGENEENPQKAVADGAN